jgi:hypothetical protein
MLKSPRKRCGTCTWTLLLGNASTFIGEITLAIVYGCAI